MNHRCPSSSKYDGTQERIVFFLSIFRFRTLFAPLFLVLVSLVLASLGDLMAREHHKNLCFSEQKGSGGSNRAKK